MTLEQVTESLKKIQISGKSESERLDSIIAHMSNAATAEERSAISNAAVAMIEDVKSLQKVPLIESIKKMSVDKSANAREGCLIIISALAKKLTHAGEPFLLPILNVALDLHSDKVNTIRDAAKVAAEDVVATLNPNAVRIILPILFEAMAREKKWQTKHLALVILGGLTAKAEKQVAFSLPDIINHVSDAMWDTKIQVKDEAKKCMTAVCSVIDNMDIEPFIPAMISSIANPSEVPDCVFKLAATTFVKTVDAPTLAIMVPLLYRGLNERAAQILRQTAVIIDNMCKLVDNHADAEQFLPKLLPGLDRIIEIAADPELRNVANKARDTLIRVGGGGKTELEIDPLAEEKEKEKILSLVKSALKKTSPATKVDDFFLQSLSYTSLMGVALVAYKNFTLESWLSSSVAYVAPFITNEKAQVFAKTLLEECKQYDDDRKQANAPKEIEEEGEDLCECEFSLAYGGMILLNNTKLKLKRGKRYGLCGANGCGKSTLMRAIANGQLEGFPSKDVVRTVYVEHDLQASHAQTEIATFVLEDPMVKELKCTTKADVERILASVGFTPEMQKQTVDSLSGGWKMKLQLARAMVMKADILLLDEPSNHLDVSNVKWLQDYLNSLKTVTCIIVSHDSGFLDAVCTGIIHYEHRKLKQYIGNLSEFVKVKPEAKAYYELGATNLKFKFPEPGFLDGIKSKDKALLKLINCSYTYPGAAKPSISGVTVQCSLNSRIAVIGPNGAGKSTMIKLLTGETIPQTGEMWKHPNLRFAYMAQHAFHHLDQHMDKTPNQYIQWRFQYGEDKELLAKETRQLTPEEEKQMKKPVVHDGIKRLIEGFLGRRKLKKSFEYEVKWVDTPHEENAWVARDQLEEWGFAKLLQAFDDKEAAKQGAYTRPLTQKEVEKHLGDFGLEAEFATHRHIKGLSGGQKVKCVIAAAMWNNPHILVLDEPTNYLDRDSLGALASAIQEYGGGVILISHNNEFTSALCPTVWNVNAGRLTISGEVQPVVAEKIVMKEEEETKDAFGNVIKVKSTKKLSRKELKAKEKKKKMLKANGIAVSDSEEEI